MDLITQALDGLRLGAATTHRNLTITPLLADITRELDYLVLEEALTAGLAHVTEVSERGSVPELQFQNDSAMAVLLIDGEELVGAKRNRVLNLTILAPPRSTITIPVSCVEAGRWADVTPEFHSESRAFYAAGRARKTAQVSDSMRHSGTRRSRQTEVWDDIEQKAARLAIASETGAMAAMYEGLCEHVAAFVEAFHAAPSQIGAVFAIGDRVRGMDLFDHPATLAKLLPKLVRSYALDAIDAIADRPGPIGGTPEDLLSEVAGAATEVFPVLGEGEDIRLGSPALCGGALQARERIVHLCAFASGSSSLVRRPRGATWRVASPRTRGRHFRRER